MTGRWVQQTGGFHFCSACRTFVEATVARPVWVFYTGTVATEHTCATCAEAAA